MAARMAGVGRVTVSLRKSIVFTTPPHGLLQRCVSCGIEIDERSVARRIDDGDDSARHAVSPEVLPLFSRFDPLVSGYVMPFRSDANQYESP
jgi:hypothetical protein